MKSYLSRGSASIMTRRRVMGRAIPTIPTIFHPRSPRASSGVTAFLDNRRAFARLDVGESVVAGKFLARGAVTECHAGDDYEHKHGAFSKHRSCRWTSAKGALDRSSLRRRNGSGQYIILGRYCVGMLFE